MLYHVTPDDIVIGPVGRNRAHTEGLCHRSGVIFLVRSDGMVLLQRRSHLKKIFPNRLDSSCSFHVVFGESYEEAAVRELGEETGIWAPVSFLGKFSHHDEPESQIVAVFKCESDDPVTISYEEATNSEFFSKNQVDCIIAREEVTPWLRRGWKLASGAVR